MKANGRATPIDYRIINYIGLLTRPSRENETEQWLQSIDKALLYFFSFCVSSILNEQKIQSFTACSPTVVQKLKKMELTEDIRKYIDKSVLCWLATSSTENIPNVSPKECFTHFGEDIIIANIASPQTVRNIEVNENVCLSFIDVLVQKGYQIKGKAKIINTKHSEFTEMNKVLTEMTGGKFPFKTITKITLKKVKPIIAPSYILFPEKTEKEQIESAKKSYGI